MTFHAPPRTGVPAPRARPAAGASAAAFTLVELIVTMTVTVLLLGVLLRVFTATVTTWQRSEERTDAFREARAAMALMARDLSLTSAPLPAGAKDPLAPVLVLDRHPAMTGDGAVSPPVPGDESNEQAYCLTAIPNRGASALCAVGYFCRWNEKRRAFTLMRQFLDSDGTFTRFSKARQSQPSPPTPERPLTFLDLFSRGGNPAPGVTDLAAYVWDLQFRLDTNLLERPAPGGAPQPPADNSAPPRAYGAQPPYPAALPAFVEIRFKALSTSAVRQLEGNPGVTRQTWADPSAATYQRIILPGMRQFTERVPLQNTAGR